jgi:hypothetical protein
MLACLNQNEVEYISLRSDSTAPTKFCGLIHLKDSAVSYSCKYIEKFTSNLVSFLDYGAEDGQIPLSIEANDVERQIASPGDHDYNIFLPRYMAGLPAIDNDDVNNMVQIFHVLFFIIFVLTLIFIIYYC